MKGKTNHVRWLLCVLLLLVAARAVAEGGVIYVDADATGANDGSSWTDAYQCLQNARADARSGDEIRVANGIYKADRRVIYGRFGPRIIASRARTATFRLKSGVAIKGGYAGFGEPEPDSRDIDLYKTILSGDLNGDDGPNFTNNSENSYHVVTGSGTNPMAVLDGFTVTGGNANGSLGYNSGGGMYTDNAGNPTVINCSFTNNSASEDGGGIFCVESSPNIENSTITGNSAYNYGGGIYCDSSLQMSSNVIVGNSAMYGGAVYCFDSSPVITNCTIVGNSATGYGGGGIYCSNSSPEVVNTILWNNSPDEIYRKESSVNVAYSDVQGGWDGAGNINTDPLFEDAHGADGVIGTEDDNLRLLLSSPCIDAGDNSAIPPSVVVDLDGKPRIVNGSVDMGAYEGNPAPNVYYVDAVNGSDDNDGLTPQAAFATIQKAIDTARNGDAVLVYQGLYQEEINFLGKTLIVQGVVASPAGVPVLQNPGNFAVSFYHGEGPDSILKNFIIRDSFMAVFIAGSSPTISNLTIVDNTNGIGAYAGSEPDISNIIFWNNARGDLFGYQARYSRTEEGGAGEGNIDANPLFVDPDSGNFHLRSERGRYWPEHDIWVLDKVTSPCIDSGDPNADALNEPMPNGGRINMGAYGGTLEASLSPRHLLLPLPDQASNPGPADGADDVKTNITLNWTGGLNTIWHAGLNTTWHEVYFGTNPMLGAAELVSEQQTDTTFQFIGGLTPHTTFYWRVDEINCSGKTIGETWTFTTGPSRPKGRTCFTGKTGVWVNGALVQISNVVSGQMVGKTYCVPATPCLDKIEKVQEHEGIFVCYDVFLESGNCISVAESHYFLTESGRWVSLQNLKTGTKLQTSKGSIGIISVAKRPMPYVGKVYNLKVEGSDRYQVGEDAVIVRDY